MSRKMLDTIDKPILYNVAQVAKMLQLGQRSVRRLMADHKIPTVRLGRRVLISAAGLAEFIEANTIMEGQNVAKR